MSSCTYKDNTNISNCVELDLSEKGNTSSWEMTSQLIKKFWQPFYPDEYPAKTNLCVCWSNLLVEFTFIAKDKHPKTRKWLYVSGYV